jgi:hypothetical protein
MLLGACWPYLDQQPAPPETWARAEELQPEVVRICSNAAREDLEALRGRWPGLRWVVRAKLPKVDRFGGRFATGDRRPDLLDYCEWPSEPSLRECLERLLGWGCAVDLELLNEPDLEWDEAASWGPLERWQRAAQDAGGYLERQLGQLRAAFGQAGPRLVGPALSEGWEARHGAWLEGLAGIYQACDALAVHAYSNGRPFADRAWGGRPLDYAARWPGKPLLLTEVNDNGSGDGLEVGEYLRWLARACPAVELACLFALPGQADCPAWWSMTSGTVLACKLALSTPAIAGAAEVASSQWLVVSDQEPLATGQRPPIPGDDEKQGGAQMAEPQLKLGMKAKADQLGAEVVGRPLEDEAYIDPNYALQFTERGVLVYSKRANRVHFLAAR